MWKLAIQPFEKSNVPIEELNGVGPARANLLRENGIASIFDLILEFPRRYIHRKTAIPIAEVEEDEFVTILGEVRSVDFHRKGSTGTLRINICDESGVARLFFFKTPGWRAAQFEKGQEVLAWGKAKFEKGKPLFAHPDYEFTSEGDSKINPVYSVFEGDDGIKIGQKLHARLVRNALAEIDDFYDPIPKKIIEEMDLPPLSEAIEKIHFPGFFEEYELAKRRLAFDELLFLQLIFAQRRHRASIDRTAPEIFPALKYVSMMNRLPFDLTEGQNQALAEIIRKLTESGRSAMLLSGDVGSGKTVVALLAAIATADSGCQTVIIIPSLLVARQHADTIADLTKGSDISVGLLTGESQSPALHNAMISGEVDIVVGTQALLSEGIEFNKLGLVIIDEQHLMGVEQRLKLPERAGANVLMLSATPIPRSTALAFFGDLDLVEIRGYPEKRAGTKTYMRNPKNRRAIWDFIEERIKAGERAFIVFPRIEGDDFPSLEYGFERLRERFGDKIGKVHGGFRESEKNAAIAKFRSGETPILAATTVISVGIDVPTASVMVIEGADKFGLAQLHQLRGRVGRSSVEGYCILMTDKPKSSVSSRRLARFASVENGLEIAQIDLENRGEGHLLKISQSGKNEFIFAEPLQMRNLLDKAKEIAIQIIKKDPELKTDKNTGLKQSIYYIYSAGEVLRNGV